MISFYFWAHFKTGPGCVCIPCTHSRRPWCYQIYYQNQRQAPAHTQITLEQPEIKCSKTLRNFRDASCYNYYTAPQTIPNLPLNSMGVCVIWPCAVDLHSLWFLRWVCHLLFTELGACAIQRSDITQKRVFNGFSFYLRIIRQHNVKTFINVWCFINIKRWSLNVIWLLRVETA